MEERKITNTEKQKRIVMTLFVTIGTQELTRRFESSWWDYRAPGEDGNTMHRQVESEFRSLCRTWGLVKAEALIVSQDEIRTTSYVTEVEVEQAERTRNTVTFDKAAEEEARR